MKERWSDTEVALALALSAKLNATDAAVVTTCNRMQKYVRRGLRVFLNTIAFASRPLETAVMTVALYDIGADLVKENRHLNAPQYGARRTK